MPGEKVDRIDGPYGFAGNPGTVEDDDETGETFIHWSDGTRTYPTEGIELLWRTTVKVSKGFNMLKDGDPKKP